MVGWFCVVLFVVCFLLVSVGVFCSFGFVLVGLFVLGSSMLEFLALGSPKAKVASPFSVCNPLLLCGRSECNPSPDTLSGKIVCNGCLELHRLQQWRLLSWYPC